MHYFVAVSVCITIATHILSLNSKSVCHDNTSNVATVSTDIIALPWRDARSFDDRSGLRVWTTLDMCDMLMAECWLITMQVPSRCTGFGCLRAAELP